MSAPLQLTRDHTCVRDMNWRCDLPPDAVEVVLGALRSVGFSDVPSPAPLPALRSPEGHQFMVVRRTGRVQIRVDYTVPQLMRRFAAEAVFVHIARALLAGPQG